jgi:hypothetical protein
MPGEKQPKENRPRGRPASGRSKSFTMRVRPELLARIERLAAGRGRSTAREVEARLEASLDASADRVDLRGLLGLVRELALGLERSYDTGRRWCDDPYVFDAFASALGTLLENVRPKGEVKVPDKVKRQIEDLNARDQHFLDAWIDPVQAGAAHAHALLPTLMGTSQEGDARWREMSKVLRELAEIHSKPQRRRAA